MLTKLESPSSAETERSRTAMPSAPDCEANAMPPGTGMRDAKVASRRTSAAVLMTPKQLGPTTRMPVPGGIAFASQPGALGIAVLERSVSAELGLSSFVSMGNKSDVSSNDLLRYWNQDAETRAILLYLESFGNPRAFARVAPVVSRTTPIVVVKSGRSTAGTRAAASHTAAMASPDAVVDALFRQAGVIRVDTLEELLDCGALRGVVEL